MTFPASSWQPELYKAALKLAVIGLVLIGFVAGDVVGRIWK